MTFILHAISLVVLALAARAIQPSPTSSVRANGSFSLRVESVPAGAINPDAPFSGGAESSVAVEEWSEQVDPDDACASHAIDLEEPLVVGIPLQSSASSAPRGWLPCAPFGRAPPA